MTSASRASLNARQGIGLLGNIYQGFGMVMLGRLQDEELRTKLAPWRTNVDLKDRWRSLVKAAQSGDPKRAGGHLNPEQARPSTLRALSKRLEGAKPTRNLTTLIRCTMDFRPNVCFAIACSADFLVSQVRPPLLSCLSCELPKPALMFNATVIEGTMQVALTLALRVAALEPKAPPKEIVHACDPQHSGG